MLPYIGVKRIICAGIIFAFLPHTFVFLPLAQAEDFNLPQPGVLMGLSPAYQPSLLVGIKVDPQNPFHLKFILNRGQKFLNDQDRRRQYQQIIKYFLASLTIPNKDMWVNLSPYEKNRIIPDNFGQTFMGRDLLVQDYILKQITSSLIYPESSIGKKFWKKVYAQAQTRFGTTNVPINTFNKVWIVPDKAEVYEKGSTSFIVKSHLKVMLEEDYLSRSKHDKNIHFNTATSALSSQIIREIVLPALEKEVNEGENFALLRQVYSAMLMATWFKKTLRRSILGWVYADRSKITGIELKDIQAKERIYQDYLKAFKTGAFNFIKEEYDPVTREIIPRKYFSGGMEPYNENMIQEADAKEAADFAQFSATVDWDVADVLLDRILKAPAFPTKSIRDHFAGTTGKVLDSVGQAETSELPWVLLVDHIVVKFIPRGPGQSFTGLPEQEIDGTDFYELPEDITAQETLKLIEEMRKKFSMNDQEGIILPQAGQNFIQMAELLEKDGESHGHGVQEMIQAFRKIGRVLLGENAPISSVEEKSETELTAWFGIENLRGLDVEAMLKRSIEIAVQAVEIELEAGVIFGHGEELFMRDLEENPENQKWGFNEINLEALQRRIAAYPSGTIEQAQEEIKVILELVNKVNKLPGLNYNRSLPVVLAEAPAVERMTGLTNCVSKSVLMASYLKKLGFKKIWAADVYAFQHRSAPAEHVLLSVRLSDGRYSWIDPSFNEEKSYIAPVSDGSIPAQGIILHLEKDPELKIVRVGPWRQMLIAMFYTALGNALENKGDTRSIAAHLKALALYPNWPAAHTNLGVALIANGDIQGAIDEHRKAIALYPGYSTAYNNLAFALNKNGDKKKAKEAYREAIRLEPQNTVTKRSFAIFLEQNNDIEGLIDFYREEIRLDPKNPINWGNLAVALRRNKDFLGAKEAYEEAIKITPTAVLLNNLGNVFFDMERYEEAAAAYQESLTMDPHNGETSQYLENALRRMTDSAQAASKYGGIDFNEDFLDMHIKRDGKDMPLPIQSQDMAMLNIQGLTPVITKISPFEPSQI